MNHTAQLTSAELGNLWNIYMANTMSNCVLTHYLITVEDIDIQNILEKAHRMSLKIVDYLIKVFEQEGIPLPDGFQAYDVNEKAPRLFSDTFYLEYLDQMAKLGCIFYAITLPNTSRMDLREFVTKTLSSTLELSNKITEIMQRKGLYIRPPLIPISEPGYVQKQSFFNGFFGDKRPLTGIEISQIFANLQFNSIKTAMLIGFSQVTQSEKIRDFFIRGKEINLKQNRVFSKLLEQEDLPATIPSQFNITTSTIPPYSDKLMLFQTISLSSAKVRNFGDSIAVSPRHDLGTDYGRILLETANFAEDGGNLLIEHGWMERPPHAPDRHKIATTR